MTDYANEWEKIKKIIILTASESKTIAVLEYV